MGKVRTRFAPSPTGRMHVGNLRTALYAYLIAKHEDGDFLLRIEDTDQERLVEGAVEIIYRTLEKTGLIHDEGPDKDGGFGPYVQSERKEIYKKYALELIKNNAENKKYGSLLWLLDKTRTGMGARLLNQMVLSPLKDIEEINYRQDGVAELVNASVVRMGLSEALKDVKDMERLSGKISNGNLMPRDCVALAGSLATLPTIKFRLLGFSSKIIKDIDDFI